jgi:Secretion system C-terminal sorting domain/Metallo-peptidase family M12
LKKKIKLVKCSIIINLVNFASNYQIFNLKQIKVKKIFTTKTSLMRMKKIYGFALVMLLTTTLPLSIFAQHHSCGTSQEDLSALGQLILENRKRDFVETRGTTTYVPVAIHLVGKSDGSGRTTEFRVLDMITGWNELYASNNIGLQFYLKHINYMSDDNVYNSPRSTGPVNKMDAQRKTDAMNVFCVNSADGVGGVGQTLAYYTKDNDWIVCINSEVSKSKSSTIAHEVGHFFTLVHTFNGWDVTPFDPSKATSVCAPALSTGPVICTENVARTGADANCGTCGDYMCDTPADYNLGFGFSGCIYNGLAKDPKCVTVDPDEKLIMGYFIGCASTFSGEQKAAMLKDYGSARRNYLRSGNITPPTTIGKPTLILPTNASTTATFNSINFDWTDVPDAIGYILEVSTSQTNFDIGRRFFINSKTSQLLINTSNAGNYFIANRVYYWRVRAFGSYVTNTDFAQNFTFTTGTASAVNEIPGIKGFTIAPNPVSESREIALSLTSEKSFKADVKIQNLAGQIVQREVRNFEAGLTNQIMDVKNLSQGMYILSIENEEGVLNKKIVIGY